jgi:hypothetical protein
MASSSNQVGSDTPLTGASITGLLTRLVEDALGLARTEVALAKAEVRGVVHDVKASAVPMAIAVGVLLAGTLTLVATLVLALAEVMRPWLAALIVSVVLLAVGVLLLSTAKKKLLHIGDRLDRTQDSLVKDAAVVARRTP